MRPADILAQSDHRPFALPAHKWLMRQTWQNLLCAHWPVRPKLLEPLIPAELQLDLWQGEAWITILPFQMKRMQLRGLPWLPLVRPFLELNVRTYVKWRGKPGIYLLSVDASSRLAVELPRLLGLPYATAAIDLGHMQGKLHFTMQRTDRRLPSAAFAGIYFPSSVEVFHASPGTRLYWLTERYCLHVAKHGSRGIRTIDIHHLPWPLQAAALEIEHNLLCEPLGIPLAESPPVLTYAEQLDVLLWPPT